MAAKGGPGVCDHKVDSNTTIRESFGQDHSDVKLSNTRYGKSFGGSGTDLSHSLKGATAKMDSNSKS